MSNDNHLDEIDKARTLIGTAVIDTIREHDIKPGLAIMSALAATSTLIAMITDDDMLETDIEMAKKTLEEGIRIRAAKAKEYKEAQNFPTIGTA